MKKTITVLLFICFSITMHGQGLIGAWESYTTSEQGEPLRSVVLFADGYQVISTYHAETGKFINSNGGTWKLDDDKMVELVEFHTDNPERVGTESRFQVAIKENEIQIVGSDQIMKRIDDGSPGELHGAWLMIGSIRNGAMRQRDTNRPRKTMKILSGTRFQWIAYNTETKKFMGTGGGSYTTINGKYTEHIEFFSRDDTKAGLSISFDYELIDGAWHHSGLSSKGDPIHEIWSIRE